MSWKSEIQFYLRIATVIASGDVAQGHIASGLSP